jgi:hypothetical protein
MLSAIDAGLIRSRALGKLRAATPFPADAFNAALALAPGRLGALRGKAEAEGRLTSR